MKRPKEEIISQFEAEKKVSGATKTFEKTIQIKDNENDFDCIINYAYYNKSRMK